MLPTMDDVELRAAYPASRIINNTLHSVDGSGVITSLKRDSESRWIRNDLSANTIDTPAYLDSEPAILGN